MKVRDYKAHCKGGFYMFTMQYDEKFIEQIAAKIADRATDMLVERLSSLNELPHILTRTEAMEVLRCGPTKMAELMARPDFPVNEECGKKSLRLCFLNGLRATRVGLLRTPHTIRKELRHE